jgi:glycosyltransferase involved in cell wall biosynthesis
MFSEKIIVKHSDCSNHRQGATFNLCLSYANAEYITFIDSDDLWHPDKIAKRVQTLDEHPEVGLVYTNGNVLDRNTRVLYPSFAHTHREANEPGQIWLDGHIRTLSTVLVRSRILRSAGASAEEGAPDHDSWHRIRKPAYFCCLEDILLGYRLQPGQFSRTSAENMWQTEYRILEKAISNHRYPGHLKKQRLAVLHYRMDERYL